MEADHESNRGDQAMKIGAMNHPARDPIAEIEWIGRHGFDFVDFTLEPPAADPDRIDPDSVRSTLDRLGLALVAPALPLRRPPAGLAGRTPALPAGCPSDRGDGPERPLQQAPARLLSPGRRDLACRGALPAL